MNDPLADLSDGSWADIQPPVPVRLEYSTGGPSPSAAGRLRWFFTGVVTAIVATFAVAAVLSIGKELSETRYHVGIPLSALKATQTTLMVAVSAAAIAFFIRRSRGRKAGHSTCRRSFVQGLLVGFSVAGFFIVVILGDVVRRGY